MVDFYNFIASWQLYPEKGTYQVGERPQSGTYRIEVVADNLLSISMNWVSVEGHAFHSSYSLVANGEYQPSSNKTLADTIKVVSHSSHRFDAYFTRENKLVLEVIHDITPKGLLKVTQKYFANGEERFNTEIYHKQLSVLPYASSASSVIIRKTEEGVIRHQALTAMEEQTGMQMNQIKKQIELLAEQARELQRRKELSYQIYESRISFAPVIGKTYYLYEKEDDTYLLSMIGASEWGKRGNPYKKFVGAVKLLADHTWVEEKEG